VEFNEFVASNARGGGRLLMGRKTYDMMVSYWPTPKARETDPVVAERMNSLPKVVFSRTLTKADWNNTVLVNGDIAAEVAKMKQAAAEGMAILGSGSIVTQLASAGVIDELQLVVHPIVLGAGRKLFDGVDGTIALDLTGKRVFPGGNVLLCYEPASA
jgi:dihydrofolate reductase